MLYCQPFNGKILSGKNHALYLATNLEECPNLKAIVQSRSSQRCQKILERAVHQQISSYLESNNLLCKHQFGFRPRRSTEMAATLLCDSIRKQVGKKKLVGAVFMDLTRTFDTVNHGKLIDKLQMYGINGGELDWFTDYFSIGLNSLILMGHIRTKSLCLPESLKVRYWDHYFCYLLQ